jgi:hypothetical protein
MSRHARPKTGVLIVEGRIVGDTRRNLTAFVFVRYDSDGTALYRPVGAPIPPRRSAHAQAPLPSPRPGNEGC